MKNKYVIVETDELKRLHDIEQIMKRMFKVGDKEGLYIGLGSDTFLAEQEGPKIKKLRKLIFRKAK